MKNKHTTIRMSAKLKLKVEGAVKRDKYGQRGKSRWVREAIEQLFDVDPGLQYVGVGEALEPINDKDVYYFDEQSRELIKNGIRILREQDPHMEGVQSLIVRAALRYRLGQLSEKKRAAR